MDHSSTLGFSPRPPVSVYGTVSDGLTLNGFSRDPLRPLALALAAAPRTIPSVRADTGNPSPYRTHHRSMNVNIVPIGFGPRLILRIRLTLR